MTGDIHGNPATNATQLTTELYRFCMLLSEEARSLQTKNEGMKRLGLNAEIMAAQTGEQGGPLEVIVSEIGRLSHSIREILGELGDASKFLSSCSIAVLHLTHIQSSYNKGWQVGIDPMGADRFKTALSQVQSRREQHLSDLEHRLRTVSGLVGDLQHISQKIAPVTTMIRIVITEVKIRSVELLGTVDDLKVFQSQLSSKVDQMEKIHRMCSKLIGEFGQEAQ